MPSSGEIQASINSTYQEILAKRTRSVVMQAQLEKMNISYPKFSTEEYYTSMDLSKVDSDISKLYPLTDYSNFLAKYLEKINDLKDTYSSTASSNLSKSDILLFKEKEKLSDELDAIRSEISTLESTHSQLQTDYNNQKAWEDEQQRLWDSLQNNNKP